MMQEPSAPEQTGVVIIYDGHCPLCTAYVRVARLRQAVGRVVLIDARTSAAARILASAQGVDLNAGMLALYGGRAYHGHEAMALLSQLSSRAGFWNCAMALALRNKLVARALYPLLRGGRTALLFMLGRGKINMEETMTETEAKPNSG